MDDRAREKEVVATILNGYTTFDECVTALSAYGDERVVAELKMLYVLALKTRFLRSTAMML